MSDIKYYFTKLSSNRLIQLISELRIIDKHLKWTKHVYKIVAKANAIIDFLKRNLIFAIEQLKNIVI